jgi:ferredoxin-NADP reductase
MAFRLDKPAGFTFKPGQTVDLSLIEPAENDAKGPKRTFSLVSAPYEDELVVATRMRDTAFKRILGTMPPGGRLQLEGPFGSLTLHRDRTRPALLIAGGIGITPFMSMLRQVAWERVPRVITLLYSNRRPQDAAFLGELEDLQRTNRNFSLVATMTADAGLDPKWSGRRGLIGPELIRGVVARPVVPVYYIAGPPEMVAGLRQVLNGMGVEDDDIRSEDFAGY